MWCTWLFPLILLFGSAIIGFIIGWLLRNQKIKELNEHNENLTNTFNQELSANKKTIAGLESDATTLNKQSADWEAKFLEEQKNVTNWKNTAQRNERLVKELNLSVTDWQTKYNTINTKALELTQSIATLEEQIKQLKLDASADAEKASLKYKDLSSQFQQLQLDKQEQQNTHKVQLAESENKYHEVNTKLIELNASLEQKTQSIRSLEEQIKQLNLDAEKASKKYDELSLQVQQLELEKVELSNQLENSTKEYEQTIQTLRNNLELESKSLIAANKEIARLTALLKQLEEAAPKELDSSVPLTKEEATLKRIKEKAKHLNFERIGLATYAMRDDLKTIKGIGPFIEKKLHALGIYTFLQISNLSPEDEEKVNEAIEFFSGRIKRDQWVKQGDKLHEEKLEQEKDQEDKDDPK